MIHANLVHLSYNMWRDMEAPPDAPVSERDLYYSGRLRCDHDVWRECIRQMAAAGLNMVVIDLGDGVEYRSHPEIAVGGAWSRETLREELAVCRDLGLEPVPKLNFSACHDAWLGEYSRKLSTPEYYRVCGDLVREVCELFDGPRLFHLGMDEETPQHQAGLLYAVLRQGTLWWHDLRFLVEQVESQGAAAWVWSDVIWGCDLSTFAANMPRSVVQSNWYYAPDFPADDPPSSLRAFDWLHQLGYRQIPTGSTWTSEANYPRLVQYCSHRMAGPDLLGFLMADWRPTTAAWSQAHIGAIEVARSAFGAPAT